MLDGIHSFVGHSFTPEDEDVVRAFTDFLDTIKKTVHGFTWEHARMPEPRLVDEKVLALFEGKNVFIGICTRKELVVAPSKVSSPPLLTKMLWANKDDFEFKTSDWIIQEIGLAIGRSMKIILLLEDGVRVPGALQGNIERIPFPRDDPSKAFGSLLAMIGSLAARATTPSGGESEGKPEAGPVVGGPAESLSATAPTAPGKPGVPQPTWTMNDYEVAMISVIGDKDKLADLDKAFRSTVHAASTENKDFWEAWTEFLRFIFRKEGNLDELRKIAARAKGNRAAETVALLASVYRHVNEPRQAAAAYEQAASLATNIEQRVAQLSSAASAYVDAGELSAADTMISAIRDVTAKDPTVIPALLAAEANRAKNAGGDKALYFGAMEASLEHKPTDHDLRFSLAYEYDEEGQNEMAVFHYSRMVASSRTPTDWNNLGVSLSKLNIHAPSIAAYRKAADAGSTLAVANIAFRFLDTGFVEDAEKLLTSAMAEADHHPNVDRALARAKDIPEEAKKLEDEALKRAADASEFYREFGKALAITRPALDGKWKGRRCDLEVTVQGDTFTAYGEYDQSVGMIASAMAGLTYDGKTTDRRFQKFSGTLRGAACTGKMTSGKVGEQGSVTSLLTADPSQSFIAYVDSAGTAIEVMEPASSGANAKRYQLTRVGFAGER